MTMYKIDFNLNNNLNNKSTSELNRSEFIDKKLITRFFIPKYLKNIFLNYR